MLIALLFAAAFTGGLVERLIGRNLTGLVGRRAVPQSDHVIVVGLGQVGLRLCLALRETGTAVVAIDDQPDGENVGQARRLGLPVVIGRGADPSLLRRLSIDQALALAAVTSDDLAEHQGRALRPRGGAAASGWSCARAPTRRAGETRSLERLGHVRDVHRIGAVYLAGLALGSAAAHVVVDGDTAHLRDAGRRPRALPLPGRGLAGASVRADARTSSVEPGRRRVDQRSRSDAPGRRKPDTPETRTPWGPQGMRSASEKGRRSTAGAQKTSEGAGKNGLEALVPLVG